MADIYPRARIKVPHPLLGPTRGQPSIDWPSGQGLLGSRLRAAIRAPAISMLMFPIPSTASWKAAGMVDRNSGPSVSISVSSAGVRRRPGTSAQFRRAWSRMATTVAERASTELESVLGKPSRVRISYPPPVL
jgi:hypothetical protein